MLFIIGAMFCVALAQNDHDQKPTSNDDGLEAEIPSNEGSVEENDMDGAESKWNSWRRGGRKHGGWRG